jgi:thiosulfate/3-mercaptopyruvate sulfurtransferase
MAGAFRFILCIALVALTACASKPTRVRENPTRKAEAIGGLGKPIQINLETVVIDARPSFEYSVAHIPASISMQWSDFTEPEPAQRGILQKDLFAATRRLARAGIGPGHNVVVVGRGVQGEGEEGRIAWMLRYMGLTNVQFVQLDALKAKVTNVQNETPLKEIPMWKPEPVESLNATRAELLFAINKRGVDQPVAFPDTKMGSVIYRIIDVRSSKAYLGKEGIGSRRRIPNMDGINIPWREFFDTSLRPLPEMAQRLKEVGIQPSHRIIVVDEDGISSAAVTVALRMLGFTKAGNYSGGLNDLMSAQ